MERTPLLILYQYGANSNNTSSDEPDADEGAQAGPRANSSNP